MATINFVLWPIPGERFQYETGKAYNNLVIRLNTEQQQNAASAFQIKSTQYWCLVKKHV